MNAKNINYKYFLFILLLILSKASLCQVNGLDELRVTPEMIKGRLDASLVKHIHPRLFFSKEDIDRVIQLNQNNDTLIHIGYQQNFKEANEVLKQPLLKYFLDDAKLRVPSVHKFAVQLPPLIMMYQLTGDTNYARRVINQFIQLSEFPDWGANRHFLDAGIGGFDFALAYDALYTFMNPGERKMMKDAVMKHVLIPGKQQLQKRIWWSTANHNWNGICNGGIIMAALAMYEDDPKEMSEIIALAINALPKYIQSFEPDGQSEEGLMYWGYGLMYTTIAMESMQRVLGSAFGLDQLAGFKKTGWFPAYVSGPVTSLSIGDDPVKNSRIRSFFWFAKNNNDSALAKMQYELCKETNSMNWVDMLYYNPGMVNIKSTARKNSLENYIHGIELMSLRDGWNKNALFVSMHGGKNFANHGHLDAGSFDIQAMGEVWAYGNLGSDNYTYPGYFSKTTLPTYTGIDSPQTVAGRWHFYRLRAEGKNCLVFNPSTRPDQNEMGEATLLNQQIGVNESAYTIDLTNCYARDVKFYSRKIQLNKSTSVITVQDDFVANAIATVWWSMHTKAAIHIRADGKSALLQINNKQMVVTIKSPAKAVFQISEATYLPSQLFPLTKNSDNIGFKKLTIKMEQINSEKIQVLFEPLKNLTNN
jgi:hypothetical protein